METKKKSKVKGIYYVSKQVGSHRYLSIFHEKSNLLIINFNFAPIKKITDIIKISEKILGKVNWDIPEKDLYTEEHTKVHSELRKAVVFDKTQSFLIVKKDDNVISKKEN